MPSESTVLRCGNCGANVSPLLGQNVVECDYCDQVTYVHQTVVDAPAAQLARAAAPGGAHGVHEPLLRGPGSVPERGRGVRLSTRDMGRDELIPADRALWPVRARASTTFGGSWSPSAMVGPPKVFPRYGDIAGAWAPSTSSSPVEWVQLEYDSELPVVGLRVYETYKAGHVYAVVDETSGDELLYASGVDARGEACALEVRFDRPRVIRKLRVYLSNRSGYTEIDTVALLARDVLPTQARQHVPPPTTAPSVNGLMLGCVGLLALLLVGVVVGVIGDGDGGESSALLEAPATALGGTTILVGTEPVHAIAARNPRWANAVVDFSTEYTSDANSAAQALGAPDVYPRAGDIAQAWAPRAADGGIQHITLHFGAPMAARAVLWLETFNPGAVVRVDDLSDPQQVVTLFAGRDPSLSSSQATAVEVQLPAPRVIHTVRLYLDTNAVSGWNEIDAVALLP